MGRAIWMKYLIGEKFELFAKEFYKSDGELIVEHNMAKS